MNVCLISRHFSLKTGGIGRYSMELENALKKYPNIKIITISENIVQNSFISLFKILPNYHLAEYIIYNKIYLNKLLLKYKQCSIYHFLTPIEFAHVKISHIKKTPVVVTFHDLIPFMELVYKKPKILKRAFFNNTFSRLRYNIHHINNIKIIAINQELTEKLSRLFDIEKHKIEIIPNGISDNLYPEQKKYSLNVIGTLSYLSPRKRIDLLIRAYRESKHDGNLWIGGSTLDAQYLKYLKKLAGEDPRIKFLGFIPDKKLREFYNSLDVFIFPSKEEGWGIPIVEALACGNPVITLSDANIPWEVQKHTYIIEPNELTAIIENPPKKPKSRDVKWAQSLRWKSIAEKVIKVYESLVF